MKALHAPSSEIANIWSDPIILKIVKQQQQLLKMQHGENVNASKGRTRGESQEFW